MKIYLVQHGRPVAKDIDPERPLSPEGRRDVERISAFLKRANVEVDAVLHSGKKRARETAEILCSALSPGAEPMEMAGLSPLDDVKACREFIENQSRDMIITGHLPHLGRLAALMITGDEQRTVALFQQGGVLCLTRSGDDGGWAVAWMLVPALVQGQ
jgi:phosphohistidine phosphatase